MKDINKLKNYRLKYKRYYGIEFDGGYDVHHIDFDRSNNDIDNLLLLPSELHQKYHFYLNDLCGPDWKSGKLELGTKLSWSGIGPYRNDEMVIGLIETIRECRKWIEYKNNLEMRKQEYIGKGI